MKEIRDDIERHTHEVKSRRITRYGIKVRGPTARDVVVIGNPRKQEGSKTDPKPSPRPRVRSDQGGRRKNYRNSYKAWMEQEEIARESPRTKRFQPTGKLRVKQHVIRNHSDEERTRDLWIELKGQCCQRQRDD